MPSLIAVGNWKMNTDISEAKQLALAISNGVPKTPGVEIVLCPPAISIGLVNEVTKQSNIEIGAQNMYFENNGPFTGEISPTMLNGLCKYVILGHSERRQIFGESNIMIQQKVVSAAYNNLIPILCVGEDLEQRNTQKAFAFVENQINDCLKDFPNEKPLVLAYEPLWAIGTGTAATPEIAQIMTHYIRVCLSKILSYEKANEISILYGGSVNKSNVMSFTNQPDINGVLVGGASLKADEFIQIIGEIK